MITFRNCNKKILVEPALIGHEGKKNTLYLRAYKILSGFISKYLGI